MRWGFLVLLALLLPQECYGHLGGGEPLRCYTWPDGGPCDDGADAG